MKLKKITVLAISLVMLITLATNVSATTEDILKEQISISNSSADAIFEQIKNNIKN